MQGACLPALAGRPSASRPAGRRQAKALAQAAATSSFNTTRSNEVCLVACWPGGGCLAVVANMTHRHVRS